jgi:hypothetical protein
LHISGDEETVLLDADLTWFLCNGEDWEANLCNPIVLIKVSGKKVKSTIQTEKPTIKDETLRPDASPRAAQRSSVVAFE